MTYNLPGISKARTGEEVDKRIEQWHSYAGHENDDEPYLTDFLGWTDEEYVHWFNTGELP